MVKQKKHAQLESIKFTKNKWINKDTKQVAAQISGWTIRKKTTQTWDNRRNFECDGNNSTAL